MATRKPWEIEPSLQEARLRALAGLMIDISNECTKLHDEAAGDCNWSLGCRIYARVKNRLVTLTLRGEWRWLRAYRQRTDLEFSIMIGSCLVQYYRGDADSPTSTHLARAEEMQRRFGFLLDDPDDAFSWFIVLERDSQNRAHQVVVQQANSNGEIRNRWIAARATTTQDGVASMAKPPQDVGAPIVTPKVDETENTRKSVK